MHGDDVTSLAGVERHEEALLKAEQEGVKVKGLLLCSPHNPLGRCYSREVIEAYLVLCQKYKIHFIRYVAIILQYEPVSLTASSDEVYAKAVFPTNDVPDPVPFTSVLSIEVEKFIDPSLVHVLYGMSKVNPPLFPLSTTNKSHL
jgi:1-aminocyclopropane-1-carboxylate synthase